MTDFILTLIARGGYLGIAFLMMLAPLMGIVRRSSSSASSSTTFAI